MPHRIAQYSITMASSAATITLDSAEDLVRMKINVQHCQTRRSFREKRFAARMSKKGENGHIFALKKGRGGLKPGNIFSFTD